MLQAIAVCVAMMAGADVRADASQAAAGGAAVQERLNRAGTELFSGTKRPGDAIPEIKAILALDPRVAEAHLLLGIAYRMHATKPVKRPPAKDGQSRPGGRLLAS
jgi:hypothetical protein